MTSSCMRGKKILFIDFKIGWQNKILNTELNLNLNLKFKFNGMFLLNLDTLVQKHVNFTTVRVNFWARVN